MNDQTPEVHAPPKVTLYDGNAVRRTLDDCVAEVMRSRFDFAEDMFWPNLKLGLMLVSCLVAAFAQFNPYFVLSGLLQLLVSYVEKDLIFTSQNRGGEVVRVRATMKKYDDKYGVTLERVETATGRVVSTQRKQFSAGTMVDVNGYVSLAHVEQNLAPLVEALKSKRS